MTTYRSYIQYFKHLAVYIYLAVFAKVTSPADGSGTATAMTTSQEALAATATYLAVVVETTTSQRADKAHGTSQTAPPESLTCPATVAYSVISIVDVLALQHF